MKNHVESISAEDPGNIDPEAAVQVGKQMGMAIVAAIVDIEFTRYVGSAFSTMKLSNCYKDFLSALVKEVEEGLQPGMVITEVFDQPVRSVDELSKALQNVNLKNGVRLTVSSEGLDHYVFLKLPS